MDCRPPDEPSMRDKPENIRRDSVRKAVRKALKPYDSCHSMHSFAGSSAAVGDYYVVPVLQLPTELFDRFRPLREPVSDGTVSGHASLIHAVVSEVLQDAHDELIRPEPGRRLFGRSAKEVALRAAASFMYSPKVAIGGRNYGGPDLFERFNEIFSTPMNVSFRKLRRKISIASPHSSMRQLVSVVEAC